MRKINLNSKTHLVSSTRIQQGMKTSLCACFPAAPESEASTIPGTTEEARRMAREKTRQAKAESTPPTKIKKSESALENPSGPKLSKAVQSKAILEPVETKAERRRQSQATAVKAKAAPRVEEDKRADAVRECLRRPSTGDFASPVTNPASAAKPGKVPEEKQSTPPAKEDTKEKEKKKKDTKEKEKSTPPAQEKGTKEKEKKSTPPAQEKGTKEKEKKSTPPAKDKDTKEKEKKSTPPAQEKGTKEKEKKSTPPAQEKGTKEKEKKSTPPAKDKGTKEKEKKNCDSPAELPEDHETDSTDSEEYHKREVAARVKREAHARYMRFSRSLTSISIQFQVQGGHVNA